MVRPDVLYVLQIAFFILSYFKPPFRLSFGSKRFPLLFTPSISFPPPNFIFKLLFSFFSVAFPPTTIFLFLDAYVIRIFPLLHLIHFLSDHLQVFTLVLHLIIVAIIALISSPNMSLSLYMSSLMKIFSRTLIFMINLPPLILIPSNSKTCLLYLLPWSHTPLALPKTLPMIRLFHHLLVIAP